MSRESIMLQMQLIFREIFDDDTLIINENTSSNDIEEWDSLENINIILSVEKTFGIKVDIIEVNNLNNVGEIVDLILKKEK